MPTLEIRSACPPARPEPRTAVGTARWHSHPTPEGFFFTPNAPLGIALSLLFLGRIAYRFETFYLAEGSQRFSAADFGRSPLTLLIFGTLAGYYVAYAIGLLRWRHTVTRGNRDDLSP